MNCVIYAVGGYQPDHPTGNVVERTIDNGDGTGTHTTYDADGNVTSVKELSGLELVPPFPSLDPVGALATLLVVEGVLPLTDAANAIHEEPAHLEHEAQAWGL